jgi:hypothetical protein
VEEMEIPNDEDVLYHREALSPFDARRHLPTPLRPCGVKTVFKSPMLEEEHHKSRWTYDSFTPLTERQREPFKMRDPYHLNLPENQRYRG